MLEDSEDFPRESLQTYRLPRSRHLVVFLAWRGDEVDGMLTGSFDSAFESGAFDSFDLPPGPHAFLERVHIRGSARNKGVGRALIEAYAEAASGRGCTFIGGLVDIANEPTMRKAFFRRLGFTICQLDNFGARPADVLKASRRRFQP